MEESIRKIVFLIMSVFLCAQVFGQGDRNKPDTISEGSIENRGSLTGQVRYFFMATDNQPAFTDYNAQAIGAQVKYVVGIGRHFLFAAGSSAVYNIFSSDLAKIDSVSKRPNRYEIGLFDLRYPNKKASARLEELYLQYTFPKTVIRLGNQLLNTPFINPEDGRMRPTFMSGLFATLSLPSTQIEGGWIGGMLPRSISNWYSSGKSIGLYPQGVNTEGKPSGYGGNIKSKGIFLAGITHTVSPGIRLKVWEQFVDNVFNTAMLQADAERKLQDKVKILGSLQYTHQVKINDGGSSEKSKGYFTADRAAQVLSAMSGMKAGRFDASLNYTRIFKAARFLMPREWGREPFFTFMFRERNEGLGDVHAFVIKTAYSFPKLGLKTSLQAGYFQLPDVKNVSLNKYGMPSYSQVNAEVRYTPVFAPKLNLQLLYAYKNNRGNTYQNPVYVFNKVGMANYSVVINYTW